MHIIIFPLGFLLWYMAYEAKPLIDEDSNVWEEDNKAKRSRIHNIMNGSL